MAPLLLRFLVPYLAVGIFWCWLKNGWLAILAYHALILFFARGSNFDLGAHLSKSSWLWIAPSVLAGPALYFLMPHITGTNLIDWLGNYSLSRPLLYLMIPYFGLIHPCIEQKHWAPLCEKSPFAHLAFAGYHLLVLATLLPPIWLLVTFASLTAVSWFWQTLRVRFGSQIPSILSHTLADLGIVAFLILG